MGDRAAWERRLQSALREAGTEADVFVTEDEAHTIFEVILLAGRARFGIVLDYEGMSSWFSVGDREVRLIAVVREESRYPERVFSAILHRDDAMAFHWRRMVIAAVGLGFLFGVIAGAWASR